MAALVEHEKRKREILDKALELFVEEGYGAVTFQKIADRCAITRTTLYIYFKNKREIFVWSIKQLTGRIEEQILGVLDDGAMTSRQCLERMACIILDECEANRQLFGVLLDYLTQLQKSGIDSAKRVRRRTVRVEHLMSTVIIRGMESGEFRRQSIRRVNGLLYGLLEDAIFRLAVLPTAGVADVRTNIQFVIDTIICGQTGTEGQQ